jgi:hypothetical protein
VTFHKIILHEVFTDLCEATYHVLYINFGAMYSFMEKSEKYIKNDKLCKSDISS